MIGEWMNERMNEWTDKMSEEMKKWINSEWMNIKINEWKMNKLIYQYKSMNDTNNYYLKTWINKLS